MKPVRGRDLTPDELRQLAREEAVREVMAVVAFLAGLFAVGLVVGAVVALAVFCR